METTNSPLRIHLHGARGRMGREIAGLAAETGCLVTGETDLGDDPRPLLPSCDAVIDFSFHDATLSLVRQATALGKPLVIGTTGHSPQERQAIAEEAAKVPTVWAGNFSTGINLLFCLTRAVATVLDEIYDAEILEMHHRFKKDSPSGTAEKLIGILLDARGRARDDLRHGREGFYAERPAGEIGVHALRGGDVAGDHTVIFAGPGERLELTHRASGRRVFALGAIRAAKWAVRQSPGLHDMVDVLGLRDLFPESSQP